MNGENLKNLLWTGFIAIIILFFVITGFKSCKNKKDEKKEKAKIEAKAKARAESSQKSSSSTLRWVIEEKRPILLTSEYGIENYVPEGKGISFENATEPYCVINGSGNEACGGKGEEISSKLPKDSRANSKLKFKLRDSTSVSSRPTIELVVWKLE